MKKILKVHFQRILSLFVLCVLCVAMFLGGQMTAPVAYADTAIGDVQMDSSNVMDDLQNSTIDGVETDPDATGEATLNFASSPWSDRLQAHLTPIQQYASPTRYDLIVSNPPYFMAGTDFRRGFDTSSAATQPTAARIAARHAEMLPYDDLIEATLRLLAPEGRFAAIFPYRESGIFIAKAASRGLYVQRMLEVHGAPHKPVKRVAVEMSRHRAGRETVIRESLSIEDGHGHFTAAYRELTRDFYLKF